MPETTALGAAIAAGIASGVWNLDEDDLSTIVFESFYPSASKKGLYFIFFFKDFKDFF